jgi:glycosyltransferase involved in cell wall biosynthesis
MDSVRIAIFTETYYPTPDGVSHYLRDIRDALIQEGHEVLLFSLTGEKSPNVYVIRGLPIPFYRQYRFPILIFPFGIFFRAKKFRPDVVHIHSPFFMGTVGTMVARFLKVPLVASFHTDFSQMRDSIHWPFKDFLFNLSFGYNKYLYSFSNTIICPSNHAVELARSYGMHPLSEIPLFVDTDRYSPGSESKEKILLFVGRITVDKGVYSVLELAKSLSGTGYRITICGTGPEEKGVASYISDHSLDGLVDFRGYVSEKEKIDLMRKAEFFVYPASADTFGISVLESLSCGTPAIVPARFPLHGYGNGDSGLIKSDFSNPDSIIRQISEIHNDPGRYRSLSTAASKFAEESFGVREHTHSLVSIYESLVRQRVEPDM